ncbi:hypothetical protein [Thermoflexus sp.]|uniref:hypothetical protein n=1 Tax=Thermoflexus sp. TaxID=1969742 RepID=UPI0035E4414D
MKPVALKELSFAQDHDTDRRFNRLPHNFGNRRLFQRWVVVARKRGLSVGRVDNS